MELTKSIGTKLYFYLKFDINIYQLTKNLVKGT